MPVPTPTPNPFTECRDLCTNLQNECSSICLQSYSDCFEYCELEVENCTLCTIVFDTCNSDCSMLGPRCFETCIDLDQPPDTDCIENCEFNLNFCYNNTLGEYQDCASLCNEDPTQSCYAQCMSSLEMDLNICSVTFVSDCLPQCGSDSPTPTPTPTPTPFTPCEDCGSRCADCCNDLPPPRPQCVSACVRTCQNLTGCSFGNCIIDPSLQCIPQCYTPTPTPTPTPVPIPSMFIFFLNFSLIHDEMI